VEIVGTDVKTDVSGRFLVDRFYQVPPPESEAYIPYLVKICEKEDITIVLPQTTREVQELGKARQDLWEKGIRVGVSSFEAISLANDKYQLLNVFSRLGLPHPIYRLVRSEEELVLAVEELGYPRLPVVVKPPTSNGMRGFRILKEAAWDADRFLKDKPDGVEISLSELLAILRRGPRWPVLLVTEYLPGQEYTVDAFCGKKAFVAVPRARMAIRSGITFVAKVEPRGDLKKYTREAAQAIGLEYAFGFQFKLDANGIPKILECNPRIQGTMVASVFAGHNIPWYAVRELLEKPVSTEEIREAGLQVAKFYRYWGGVGVIDGDVVEEI
jgi:carbamoyl-phosphate synthase large subunit